MEKKPLAIYIHIPFCVRKCLYCDFLSFPSDEDTRERYVKALICEIRDSRQELAGYRAATVFMGGGTPSVLTPSQMSRIGKCLRESYDISEDAEVTTEANPGTLTRSFLEACRDAGVNRISLGLQSADDEELERIGRIHRYSDFLESYRLCRSMDFSNINIDLMSALPGQDEVSWKRSLRRVAELSPEHISAYSLILEEGTPLYDIYGGDERSISSEETDRVMYSMTREILGSYGYERYEISNYARPGYECQHNITYWKRGDYMGFGLGAASLLDNVRFKNIDDMAEYLDVFGGEDAAGSRRFRHRDGGDIAEGGNCDREYTTKLSQLRRDEERLGISDQMEETMFLGLRMMKGVSEDEFWRTFGHMPHEIYGDVLERYMASGHLVRDGGYIFLSDKGIDVSNTIMADFLL